jgi:hypothetical protein
MSDLAQRIYEAVGQFRLCTGRSARAVYLPAAEYEELQVSLMAAHPLSLLPDGSPAPVPLLVSTPRAVVRQDRIVFPYGYVVLRAVNLTRQWAFIRPLRGPTYHFRLSA